MLNSSDGDNALPNALPFEEALDWKSFSTLADVYDLANLGKQLECLTPQVLLHQEVVMTGSGLHEWVGVIRVISFYTGIAMG